MACGESVFTADSVRPYSVTAPSCFTSSLPIG